MTDIAQK